MTVLPLAVVAAVGRNWALGRDNKLPWHLPGDLAHFRDLTLGTPMVMGRRTFQSIGRALPGRESVVVSRDPTLGLPRSVHSVTDPSAAVDLAQRLGAAMGARAVSLIGGAALFDALMPRVDRLHMTFVDLSPDADVFFPPIDTAIWREASRVAPQRRSGDEVAYVFADYVRA